MSLPASFLKSGFVPPDQAARSGTKYKRLMIGTEGETNTGKTEFMLSCPGPGIMLCLDRGFDPLLDNPNPPAARNGNFGFKVIYMPKATQMNQDQYLSCWKVFLAAYIEALDNQDARTVCIDGDTQSWELQRLAEFGTLNAVRGVPGLAYTNVYAARRALINRAWDSGKVVVASNMLRAEFKPVLDANNKPIMEGGQEKKTRTGNLERQGFPDQDYLWQVQIRHLYQPPRINSVTNKTVPGRWGFKILKCKCNTELQGHELWDEQANFRGLVELAYPTVPLDKWGL